MADDPMDPFGAAAEELGLGRHFAPTQMTWHFIPATMQGPEGVGALGMVIVAFETPMGKLAWPLATEDFRRLIADGTEVLSGIGLPKLTVPGAGNGLKGG